MYKRTSSGFSILILGLLSVVGLSAQPTTPGSGLFDGIEVEEAPAISKPPAQTSETTTPPKSDLPPQPNQETPQEEILKKHTQRSVVLYSQPNRASEVMGTQLLTEELKQQSKPAPGTSPEEFWFVTERKDRIKGYVHNSDLGKDFSIKEGAAIYENASRESTLLFQWEKGEEPEFGDVIGHFTEVTSNWKTSLYYQALPHPAVTPATTQPPTPKPSRRAALPQKPTPVTKGEGQPIASIVTSYRMLSKFPDKPKGSFYFQGTLRPYRSTLQFRRDYRFELIGSDHERIAFIDMDEVTSARTLSHYFYQRVLIYGTVEKVSSSSYYLIQASQIRSR